MDWSNYDPYDLLRMLIFGEAEGEGVIGQLAVGLVVRNRVYDANKRFGDNWTHVMLRPKQFSCFNEGSVRIPKMLDFIKWKLPINLYDQISWIMRGIMEDAVADDITHGANHYLEWSLYIGEDCPEWAKGVPLHRVGNHAFLRL